MARATNEQSDTDVEMKRCTAYEITSLARQKVVMEHNPAYEDVTNQFV